MDTHNLIVTITINISAVLGIGPRVQHMLNRCSASELSLLTFGSESYYVSQASLKVLILLPQHPSPGNTDTYQHTWLLSILKCLMCTKPFIFYSLLQRASSKFTYLSGRETMVWDANIYLCWSWNSNLFHLTPWVAPYPLHHTSFTVALEEAGFQSLSLCSKDELSSQQPGSNRWNMA